MASAFGSEGDKLEKKPVKKRLEYYKVHIKSDNTNTKILCYWCFSPSQMMQDLLDDGARSIILTSGTLSPIESLKIEMKIPFDVVLENPHIIKPHQIKVLCINKGPKNVVLKSNYDNRSNETYMESLGQLIVFISKVVPHGVLVFFPSYYVLDQTLDFWRKTNQWQLIGDAKCIFIESKNAKDCNDTIIKYYERVKDPRGTGAILFAVCRGKMSEGIDFANEYGRAVIITGLPYPPYKDPRVVLKKQFLDESRLPNLNGQVWYNQQAFRAVNQAVGRVIRHKDDYGAIILCDERFSYDASVKQMPSWLKSYVKKHNNCEGALEELKSFFKVAVDIMPKISAKGFQTAAAATAQGGSSAQIRNMREKAMSMKNERAQDFAQMAKGYELSEQNMFTNSQLAKSENLLNALENASSFDFTASGLSASQSMSAVSSLSLQSNQAASTSSGSSFQEILQRRKAEEEAKNSKKCKVVIRETLAVAETNKANLSSSRDLLGKVNKALNEEDNKHFKLALSNFYTAKKNNDEAGKQKYYTVLKTIFHKSDAHMELFKEIEAFIRFKPKLTENVDFSNTRVTLKRKHEASS